MSVSEKKAPAIRALTRVPRLLAVVAVGLFIALLAYGLAKTAPDDTIDRRLADSRSAPAPGFSLAVLERGVLPPRLERKLAPAMADGELALEEVRGAPVMLNFWASWCIPCREEAPVLQRGWERWGKRGVLFIGLDMQDLRSDARSFLREFRITYPSIRDPGKEVSLRYGATGIPETYFITARGRVVAHAIGAMSSDQLNRGVVAARSAIPLDTLEGGARLPSR
jgi:cytochrome c biogenesis protein CcmG, thiol:disulfide interchange protein DsbE